MSPDPWHAWDIPLEQVFTCLSATAATGLPPDLHPNLGEFLKIRGSASYSPKTARSQGITSPGRVPGFRRSLFQSVPQCPRHSVQTNKMFVDVRRCSSLFVVGCPCGRDLFVDVRRRTSTNKTDEHFVRRRTKNVRLHTMPRGASWLHCLGFQQVLHVPGARLVAYWCCAALCTASVAVSWSAAEEVLLLSRLLIYNRPRPQQSCSHKFDCDVGFFVPLTL